MRDKIVRLEFNHVAIKVKVEETKKDSVKLHFYLTNSEGFVIQDLGSQFLRDDHTVIADNLYLKTTVEQNSPFRF